MGSTGWQEVGEYLNLEDFLNDNDTNTITVLAANEFYHPDNSTFEFNNSPVPPYTPSPYRQQNPGAMIFKLDIQYTEPPINPPVPEVPAAVLLGLGLGGLCAFIIYANRRKLKPNGY